VLLPDSLDDDLDEIRKRLRLEEGTLWDREKRLFNVSHRTAPSPEASESTTLYDVPNILTSAAKLYGYSRHNERQRRRPEWIHQTKLELSAFKIRLQELVATERKSSEVRWRD
jgi:hypothetical protein